MLFTSPAGGMKAVVEECIIFNMLMHQFYYVHIKHLRFTLMISYLKSH